MQKSLIGLTLLALGFAGTAYAAETRPGGDPLGDKSMTKAEFQTKGAAMFARMDANQDGKVNAADRAAHMGHKFDTVDVNHDGALSRDEFMAKHQRGPSGVGADGAGPEGKHRGKHRGWHQAGGGHGGMMLRMADTNQDGAVSKDEFMTTHVKHFDLMDANHDGQLTTAERQAARQKMRATAGMGGGKRHDGKHGGHDAMGDMPPPPPAN